MQSCKALKYLLCYLYILNVLNYLRIYPNEINLCARKKQLALYLLG